MSKFITKKDGMLKIFELQDLVDMGDINNIEDITEKVILLNEECDFYDVLEPYVFFKSKEKYYVYNLDDKKTQQLELNKPVNGNIYTLFLGLYKKLYIAEKNSLGNIISIYITEDNKKVSANTGRHLKYVQSRDYHYICEVLDNDETITVSIRNLLNNNYVTCNYGNKLEVINFDDAIYIAEKNFNNQIVSLHYMTQSVCSDRFYPTKITTRYMDSYLEVFEFEDCEFIKEIYNGTIISIYGADFKCLANEDNYLKLENIGNINLISEIECGDVVRIYNISRCSEILKTHFNSYYEIGYISQSLFCFEKLRSDECISMDNTFNGARVVAGTCNRLEYKKYKDSRVEVIECNSKGKKLSKRYIDLW